jgi:hypothetical protein
MRRQALLAGICGIVLLGAALIGWRSLRSTPPAPRLVVHGGDGGGLPRAQPQEESFDAAALERVSSDAAAAGMQALVVMRHGHLVLDRYGHGVSAQSDIDGGGFARVLPALLLGIAVHDGILSTQSLGDYDANRVSAALAAASHQSYPQYLSQRLWRRINASQAWVALPADGASAPGDCCLHARVTDWMRLAGVLLEDGRFEGARVVPAGWVEHMRRTLAADGTAGAGLLPGSAARGVEAFASNDVFYLRGPGHWRLWCMPGLQLAVLFGSALDTPWDETRLPNLVMRAMGDLAGAPGASSKLQQLVPGH